MSIFNFVKSNLAILDVVLEYAQLKRAGGYWKGSCPFHQEKDASFTVSPDKQIFYCFGCHAGGDLISFIAKIENLSQYEAVCHLIERYNLTVPPEIKQEVSHAGGSAKKDQHFQTCQAVARWAHEQLLSNKEVMDYLIKRGIGLDECKYFNIGYFPGGSRATNMLLKGMARHNVLAKDLLAAGIVAQGRISLYSPFEERIVFPISDVLGRGCGFGGRIFRSGDDRAKYYNSRESEWFAKGKLLFGLDLAKKEMQSANTAFLVEGYTDCVAMVGHGYKNTVATLGTACTVEHLKKLSRYVQVLYVLYDGDKAGQKAILRLTKLCWEANLELQIITLPESDDPASFLERGGDLASLQEKSCDIFTFFVRSLGERFWNEPLSEKMKLCSDIVGVIGKINDAFKQDLLLQQASNVMQVPFETLQSLLKSGDVSARSKKGSQEIDGTDDEIHSAFSEVSSIERQIVSLVINSISKDERLQVENDLRPYFSKPMKRVLHVAENTEVSSFDQFVACFEDPGERNWILQQGFAVDEGSDELFEHLMFRFRKQNWKKIVQGIKKQIFEAKQENDEQKLRKLLASFLSLKREMQTRGLL